MSIESAVRQGVRKALREDEQLSDVDVEEGKMHELLGVPDDEDIEDQYDSGEQLARDLVDATGDEKEASGMIAFAANINSEEDIYDDALDAIGEIDFEEQQTKRQPMIREAIREAIREVLTEDDDYQEFVQGVMETLNIDSPQDLTEDGREKFFNMLGNNYDEDTDEADDIPTSEIKNTIDPSDYKDESKCPDFLKENEIRQKAKNALREALIRMNS